MRVHVNTDSSIKNDERLEEYVEEQVTRAVGRFKEDVTRIEVHLNDVNKDKGGVDDKRCMMEARVDGLAPIAVTHHADNVRAAIAGATEKLKSALDTAIGKRKNHR